MNKTYAHKNKKIVVQCCAKCPALDALDKAKCDVQLTLRNCEQRCEQFGSKYPLKGFSLPVNMQLTT